MKNVVKLNIILFIVASIGWGLKQEHHQMPLSDLTLNNIAALASSESSNECEGCMPELYICKYFGDWGGCFGIAYIFEV